MRSHSISWPPTTTVPLPFTALTPCPRYKSTPEDSNAIATAWLAKGVSSGKTRSAISKSETLTPNLESAKASSQPIAPAPRIARELGGAGRSNIVSLVRGRDSTKPGIGGMAALAPVHRAIRRAFSGVSPTQICPPALNNASPRNTSTPASMYRSTESCGAIPARTSRSQAKAC